MQLTNSIPVKASPDDVFTLMNDVERVASCMPGAALEGQDGDTWKGSVKVKVGPITASYAGTVRFLEVDSEHRRLRVHARGADTHGSGDAEAEVVLDVLGAPEGALLQLATDLVIRGKIAQFGKGAIGAVSERILRQFAQNLAGLLDQDHAAGQPGPLSAVPAAPSATAPAAAHPALAPAAPARQPELDGVSMVFGPAAAKYGMLAGAFALGLVQGWLVGRMRAQSRELRTLRRSL
ncbi:SRPBCC family protein [Streptomyces violaceusniger]|uniref:Carbon monoxide dehydrogenase subunit G n=1 Tax=Streptomyces violaceusniger (strain Tu 4113) TaxID=653045 RepID=G2NUE7_STRV4|nr:SRPBCC family protein [Streptomyces violaceusniger]AEM84325.1 carbon monoxide dehydrogenase subunit G [Streptomyces violaceusniger Tu 4113]